MTDNATLAKTIAMLGTAMKMTSITAPPTHRGFGTFASSDPFNISPRSESSTYATTPTRLDDISDGDVFTFLSFVTALRIRTKK